MRQFVCVRLVQMGGVDLGLYQFDPHVSWALFFMHADKTIYGRYGSASPTAKRSIADSNPNHTLAGLKAALTRALALHQQYKDDAKARAKTFAAKTGTAPRWRYAEKTPAARKYKRLGRVKGKDTKSCVHCHEVHRTQIDSHFMTKTRIPDRLLWVYPRPSVLGLTMSRDRCAQVTRVAQDSLASAAGVRVGDDIVTLAGQPLVSEADIRWVLHNFPDEGGALPLQVSRDGKVEDLTLELEPLWRRKEDFAWRYRMAGYAAWLWGGVTVHDHPDGVRVAARSPGWFKKTNREARKVLQRGDLIQAVDGKTGWTRSTYLAYLMRDKKLGSSVLLQVMRKGKPLRITFKIPKEQPEVLGH